MSIETEIKKLTAAITELTAALSTQETHHEETSPGTTHPAAEVPPSTPVQETPTAPALAPAAPPAPDSPAPLPDQAPPPAPAATTTPPPAPAEAPPAPAPVEQPTIDAVNAALVDKAGVMGDGGAAIFKMLQDQFGVTGLSQIPAERLGEVLTAVEALG